MSRIPPSGITGHHCRPVSVTPGTGGGVEAPARVLPPPTFPGPRTHEMRRREMDQSTIADDQLARALSCDRHDLYEEMSQRALVSIAASLREIAQTPVPIEGELVASGCCRQADDMLEAAFGLICNAGNSISSGGALQAEWDEAARRFIDSYNARMCARYGLARHRAAEADAFADELAERSAD